MTSSNVIQFGRSACHVTNPGTNCYPKPKSNPNPNNSSLTYKPLTCKPNPDTILTGSPHAQTPLIALRSHFLIPALLYILKGICYAYCLREFSINSPVLSCLFLFVETDARHQIVAPPSFPQRWLVIVP